MKGTGVETWKSADDRSSNMSHVSCAKMLSAEVSLIPTDTVFGRMLVADVKAVE